MKLPGVLLVSATIGLAAAQAQPANSVSTSSSDLPSGLVRQGGVIMMQPIAESEEGPSGGKVFGGERRAAMFRALSPFDHELFGRAVQLADHGDWSGARGLAQQGRDPTAQRIIEWGYLLDRNSGAPFAEVAQFLKEHPDWPARETLYARAEAAMPAGMDPTSVIAWFGDREPRTGMGKVRLGEALIDSGSAARGQALIREAWIDDNFQPDQESYVISRHGDLLGPDVAFQRVERLLFRDHLAATRQELARLSPESRRLAEVRLDLHEHPSLGEREIAGLPGALRDDPGLLVDEVALYRERNDFSSISALLERVPASRFANWSPTRWWSKLNQDARTALRLGFDRAAYRIAAAAALPRDASEYPDAELLAGWIALRRLGEPRLALTHFQNLIAVATHPVTRSRAHYWAARALEAVSETAAAAQEFRAAATDPPTFYGQLALMHLESSPLLHLETTPTDTAGGHELFEHDFLVPAIRVLADLGLEALLREFAAQDADLHPDAQHLKLLMEDLVRMGYREVAVRVAKTASYDGYRFYDYSHPVIPVPRYIGAGIAPENALVLAIIRQETEFDPAAVSVAGARGLMQIMPDVARQTAEKTGLGYRPGDLTSDVTYNMELGTAQLAHDLSVWDGSYLMAAAAYNAGLGNVHKWVVAFGDPRDPRIDPLDWIQEIPFSETRNYVERVLENVEVYRNRLVGHDLPLEILADLHRTYTSQAAPYAPASLPIAPAPAADPVTRPQR